MLVHFSLVRVQNLTQADPLLLLLLKPREVNAKVLFNKVFVIVLLGSSTEFSLKLFSVLVRGAFL